MSTFLIAFIFLIASPLANSSSGWIFYGRRRPSLSAVAKGLLPQSERVAVENESQGEVITHTVRTSKTKSHCLFTPELNCYNCTFSDLFHDIPACAINDSIPNDITPCIIGCVKMEVDLAGKLIARLSFKNE